MGTYYAGIKLTPLDMSPNYAGTLMGIANGIGSITGLIIPYLTDILPSGVSYTAIPQKAKQSTVSFLSF